MIDQVAAVVVRHRDKVLLLKRAETLDWAPGKWCFPMGHVDSGETPLEAAVRETQEEADLSVTGLKPLMNITLPGRHITCFQAKNPGTDVAINDESSDWAWVPIAEVPNYDTTPDVPQALEALSMSQRLAARFKQKKEVPSEDGGKTTIYEYSDRQVALRNTEKAKRIEKLRKSYSSLEGQVRKDLKAKDTETFLTALAVALMDETYERVGNDDSASEGHFGVTGWRREHVTFSGGTATISYVGKSGVKQKKTVSGEVAKHLQKAYNAADSDDSCLFCPKDSKVDASKINDYLAKFDITAKDLRGYHANDAMKNNLKKVRKGELPSDPKEREKKLKAEYTQALEATAKEVGHESSTLNSQYLVPGLEDDYTKDGTINEKMVKDAAAYAYHGTKLVAVPYLQKYGLVPGSASSYSDRYSEFDDGRHLFFSDDESYVASYGPILLRFPWPKDTQMDQNVYGRKLPHQYVTKHSVSVNRIQVKVGQHWVLLSQYSTNPAERVAARYAADKIRAYKVMSLQDGKLVSGANSRLGFPARKGATIRMPGNGVYMSPNKRYVLDYYSGLADNEVLLTLEFNRGDIKWGNLTDREAEVAASPVKILDIEPLDD